MYRQLAFRVGQPLALLVNLLLCRLLGQHPFCRIKLLTDLGDPLLFACELPPGDGLAQAGIEPVDTLLGLGNALPLAINRDVIRLAGDLP